MPDDYDEIDGTLQAVVDDLKDQVDQLEVEVTCLKAKAYSPRNWGVITGWVIYIVALLMAMCHLFHIRITFSVEVGKPNVVAHPENPPEAPQGGLPRPGGGEGDS